MIRQELAGWKAATLVAITYVYFLIFAQFGFLARLAALGIAGDSLKTVMAAMAAGGILFSLLVPKINAATSPALRLRIALGICVVASILSLLPLSLSSATSVAFLIGAGLGILTVTLVTHLHHWTGTCNPVLMIGIGTGIGYFLCNVPAIFTASPKDQALWASGLCAAGTLLATPTRIQLRPASVVQAVPLPFPRALVSFAALVWLDSAAFYIIQHTPALKSGTWMGELHLWTNACIHFAAAVLAALLLQDRRVSLVLACAFVALGSACLLLLDPALTLSASLLYPLGVSFYSVALVAYPSYLSGAETEQQRARLTGWIYAVAGWTGSALGIGMGQNLGHVPVWFVLAAGIAILLPVFLRQVRVNAREVGLLCAALVIAYTLTHWLPAHSPNSDSAVDKGRQVYISEGCIHCHSQYVRPNTQDVLLWGPAESLEQLHNQQPPLIGNRRQGPDLSQVGARRSTLWLKAHLMDPVQVSGDSIMPSYAFLFRDNRGESLVAYLASLQNPFSTGEQRDTSAWRLAEPAWTKANPAIGEQVYQRDCKTCHEADGATRTKWSASFRQPPSNLLTGPFKHLQPSESMQAYMVHIAQIAKFGIPGTDMPGHEYLSDSKIASLSLWLAQHATQPFPHS